jgi:acyl carrier protein
MTIHSKASTEASREGHDRIWGKKETKYKVAENPDAPVGHEPYDQKRERIWTELKRVAKEWLGQDAAPLDSSFAALGADSLDQIEMLMDIEETFEIEIDDDTAQKFKTVNDVLNYLVVHVAS